MITRSNVQRIGDDVVTDLGYDKNAIVALGSIIGSIAASAVKLKNSEVGQGVFGRAKASIKTAHSGMHDIVDLARLDPLCVSDDTLRNWESYDELLSFSLNVVSSYYLRTISMLSIDVDLTGMQILRSIKPGLRITKRSMALDAVDLLSHDTRRAIGFSTQETRRARRKSRAKGGALEVGGLGSGADSIALGKVLPIKLSSGTKEGDAKINLDLVVTLTVKHLEKKTWISMGSLKNVNRKVFAGWGSGDKSLHEMLETTDRKRTKRSKKDKKVLDQIRKNRSSAKASTLQHGHAHYGVVSSTILLSKETAEAIEDESHIDFDNEGQRDSFMDVLEALVLVIVDKESNYMWVYYKNVPLPSELTSKQMRRANGSSDGGMEKILTALILNKPASL